MANFGASVTSEDTKGIEWGEAASTVAAGDAVYKSATTGLWAAARSNATGTLGQTGIKGDMGVALGGAVAGQRFQILIRGYLEGASSLAPGQAYVVSDAAAGSVIAHSTLTEDTDYACLMGLAVTASTAYINPINTGVVINLV